MAVVCLVLCFGPVVWCCARPVFIYIYTYIHIYLSIYLSIYLFMYLSILAGSGSGLGFSFNGSGASKLLPADVNRRRSKYPMFEVSSSETHTHTGIWDQGPQYIGYLDPLLMHVIPCIPSLFLCAG